MPTHVEHAFLVAAGLAALSPAELAQQRQAAEALAQWRQQWRQTRR